MGNDKNDRRHKNWKGKITNDIFIKLMVSLAVGFMIASYNTLSKYIIENSEFKGTIIEFRATTERDLRKVVHTVDRIDKELNRRAGIADYAGKLKDGDEKTLSGLCHHIVNIGCDK